MLCTTGWKGRTDFQPVGDAATCMCKDGIMLVTMLEYIRRISVRRQNHGIPFSIHLRFVRMPWKQREATYKTTFEPRFDGTRTRRSWLAFLSGLTFLELTSTAMERKLPSNLPKTFRIWSAGPVAFRGCCPTSINANIQSLVDTKGCPGERAPPNPSKPTASCLLLRLARFSGKRVAMLSDSEATWLCQLCCAAAQFVAKADGEHRGHIRG